MFSKFYYRHSELIVKNNICLKTLLQQGISEPVLYGDLVYKFKRIVGKPNFSDKGALSWYGKLTWESAHAWKLIILCLLIVWGMTFIFMVHLSFYAIPMLIYDVMYNITTIP